MAERISRDIRKEFHRYTGLEVFLSNGEKRALSREEAMSAAKLFHTSRSEWPDDFKQYYTDRMRGDLSLDGTADVIASFVASQSLRENNV